MPFKYSCFISYRHGQRELVRRIINDLYEALSNELELLLNEEVYVDWERLKGGDFYNEALATALCESVCMIMVFTPRYFDEKHTFCTREYKAMEKLEGERLRALGSLTDKQRGLIIPIVFQGGKLLPKELKERRHCYDFSGYQLYQVKLSKHRQYARQIREIAETIFDHYQLLGKLSEDPCCSCAQFALPPEAEIRPWLEGVRGSANKFPGR